MNTLPIRGIQVFLLTLGVACASVANATAVTPKGKTPGLVMSGDPLTGFSQPVKTVDLQAVDTQERIKQIVQTTFLEKIVDIKKALNEKLQAIKEKNPNITPDEIDIRIDFGIWEVGVNPLETEKMPLKELTLKHPSGLEFSMGIKGTWEKPEWDGKVKYGYAWDKQAELKYGMEIDTNKTTNDFYDGEWQKESEWRIVRFFEDTAAKVDFYVGGAAGVETPLETPVTEKLNIGVEVSWNLRDRYTNWLFKDMYDSLDQLNEQLDHQEEWRRGKIEDEARRLDLNPQGKTTRQLIRDIQEEWRKHPDKRHPIFRPPDKFIHTQHEQHDWYCTNRPVIDVPVTFPPFIFMDVPIPAPRPPPVPNEPESPVKPETPPMAKGFVPASRT
jgi:hypothetical protein